MKSHVKSESENEGSTQNISIVAPKVHDSSDGDLKRNTKILNNSSNDNSRDSSVNVVALNESSVVISSHVADDEAEGLTLTSMVKNLNEDFKKRKNQEKKEKKLGQKVESKKFLQGGDEEKKSKNLTKIKLEIKKEESVKKTPTCGKYSLAKSSSSSSVASRINSFEVIYLANL